MPERESELKECDLWRTADSRWISVTYCWHRQETFNLALEMFRCFAGSTAREDRAIFGAEEKRFLWEALVCMWWSNIVSAVGRTLIIVRPLAGWIFDEYCRAIFNIVYCQLNGFFEEIVNRHWVCLSGRTYRPRTRIGVHKPPHTFSAMPVCLNCSQPASSAANESSKCTRGVRWSRLCRWSDFKITRLIRRVHTFWTLRVSSEDKLSS